MVFFLFTLLVLFIEFSFTQKASNDTSHGNYREVKHVSYIKCSSAAATPFYNYVLQNPYLDNVVLIIMENIQRSQSCRHTARSWHCFFVNCMTGGLNNGML